MTLIINAFLATIEMMGMFFSTFLAVYLLALFLSPIESRLSRMVWKHSGQHVNVTITKPSFREFSKKYR